ncbi:hypothetical protein BDV25DRAFT_141721 [Aspergillus avenaceus]|uniref:Uncharacterized protein n=1 Tax=Aspergillus avenaceus TaxID=36643 RepID=A0A5N6TQ82_ASPAV|nr:hypothetical protein BDV25DRAFT_141721 [Aspergillus avenaceus]
MDEIDTFFAQYPGFAYSRDQPIHAEFYRMCDDFRWRKDEPERERAWKLFRIAVVQAFNSTVGSDANDLASWQRICLCLGISPMPKGLHNAQQAVVHTHVNLVDLLQSIRAGSPVEAFSTLEDLRAYTIENRKYFPKEEAYEGGLLRFLLREIHNEYKGKQRPARERRKGRSRNDPASSNT